MRWHASGYRNELEQSERPQGPWIVETDSVDQVEDLARNRLRSLTKATIVPFPAFDRGFVSETTSAMRLNGKDLLPGNVKLLQQARETLALSPERLLLTALAADDLSLRPKARLQDVMQDTVGFTLDGAPVTLYLNPYTHLPTAVDYSGPLARSGYWAFAGTR